MQEQEWRIWKESERQQKLDEYLDKHRVDDNPDDPYPSITRLLRQREAIHNIDGIKIDDYQSIEWNLYPSMRKGQII